MARRSPNAERTRTIRQTNDRFRAARLIEASLFTNTPQEIATLTEGRERGASWFRPSPEIYRRRRIKVGAEIVRRLYRDNENIFEI